MSSRGYPALIEVFLLVDQPRQRLSHWSRALAPLDETIAPPLATVDAYFEPASNQAIFGLRYDEAALGPARLSLLTEVTVLAEIATIHPAELSDGDRRRFIVERLAKCTVHVADQRKVVGALVELVRRVRGQKPSTSPPALGTLPPGVVRARTPAAASRARHETSDPNDPFLLSARGTRNGAHGIDPAQVRPSRDLARGTLAQSRFDLGETAEQDAAVMMVDYEGSLNEPVTTPGRELADSLSELATTPALPVSDLLGEPVTTPARQLVGSLPQRRDDGPRPSPNVVTRAGVHRANTVEMSTTETQRMIDAASSPTHAELRPPLPPDAPAIERGRSPSSTIERARSPSTTFERARSPSTTIDRARLPVPAGDSRYDRITPVGHEAAAPSGEDVRFVDGAEPGMITARYLRGGRWVPIRVGALSLRGATLMAGALPRADDRVDVALAYASNRAIVRGTVTKVSTRQEAATTGAATFLVSFELDDSSRRQLTTLLTAARAANVTIKPPPPRSTRRYPVEWPICLGTARGAVRAEALDVSSDGMFIKPLHTLAIDANLTFSVVLDDGLSPVTGRIRVVRSISDHEAQVAGLISGYGLSILEMAEPDRARWAAFLARVEKRAGKRVLIGASAVRLAELQGGLVAAGYAVTGGTDPGAIAQLASGDARPVDAALVDAAWVSDGQSASWVESLFSARNVPCVTIHGDARRARIAIDRLLSVV